MGDEPNQTARPRRRRRALIAGAVAALWLALLAVLLWRGPLADLGPGGGSADGEASGAAEAAATGRVRVRATDAEGTALEEARVSIAVPREGRSPVVAQGDTDEAGRAELRGLPAGTGRVTVELSGFERVTRVVQIAPDEVSEVDLALPLGGALAGLVVDQSGEPIAGAQVRVRPEDDDAVPAWEGITNDAGRFSFDTLRRGPQRLEATADGYDSAGRRVATGDEDLRIALRRTGSIAGIVTLPDGGPAEGATVVLVGSGVWPSRSIETDAEGTFRIAGVPGGIYELRASRGDLVAEPREGIFLTPGQDMHLDFRLAEGATLRGLVVRAEDEAPLEGAEVVVSEEALAFQPIAARTGEDGSFQVSGLRRRPHRVSVHAEGYVSIVADPREPTDEPVRFEMRRAAVLAGVVLDEQDQPVEGAQVEVIGTAESGGALALSGAELAFREALFSAQLEGPLPIEAGGELGVTLGTVPPIPLGEAPAVPVEGTAPEVTSGASFTTDADGRFRLTGVPPGRLQLVARHPSHAPGTTRPLLVTAGSTHEDLEIQLPTGGVVEGRVVDGRGFPIGHVRVEMHGEHEPYPRVTLAAEDGTFRFEGALGTTTLTAYPAGRPAARKTLPVQSGETLEVELPLEGELTILAARTVDAEGWPIGGARVTVRSLRARSPVERTALSAEDGTLEVPGLPPPPWRVVAQHDEYASVTLRQVRSAEEELRIALPSGASVRGTVRDGWEDGPVGGAVVSLRGGGRTRRARTNSEGSFEFQRVPAGDYEVIVEHDGFLPARREVALELGSVGLADLDLDPLVLSAGGSVSGEVVDALGAPVAGAEVAWGDPPGWAEAARTDARGRFTLTGLPPGDVSLVARHPAAGESEEPSPARVFAREETPGQVLRLAERFDDRDVDLGDGRRSGVAVVVRDRDGAVHVASVAPDSHAARAGVRPGDVLLSVDDEESLTAAQAQAMLRGPAGSEAILEVERGGRTLRLPVERERYQSR